MKQRVSGIVSYSPVQLSEMTVNEAMCQWHCQLQSCIQTKGGHFEQQILSSD